MESRYEKMDRRKRLAAMGVVRENPTPADEAKMSAAILEVARPLLESHGTTVDRIQAIIMLTVAGWNKSMLPPDKRPLVEKELIDCFVPRDGSAEVLGVVVEVMEGVTQRRKEMFPALSKIVVDYEVNLVDDNLTLNVTSAAISDLGAGGQDSERICDPDTECRLADDESHPHSTKTDVSALASSRNKPIDTENRFSSCGSGLEMAFFERIGEVISGFEYSIEPFLRRTTKMNVYDRFFEFEGFYYDGWKTQSLKGAKGLCQHLSYLTRQFLSDLTVDRRRFDDFFDVYFATGVFESRHFNDQHASHICLVAFRRGDRNTGWIIDPSLKTIEKCSARANPEPRLVPFNRVFATDSAHRFLIPATFDSSLRKDLDIKGGASKNYSNSFDSCIPLLIDGNGSLIFASFHRDLNRVWVDYHEHRPNKPSSESTRIPRSHEMGWPPKGCHTVFSLIDDLVSQHSITDTAHIDSHPKLAAAEIERDYLHILHAIEFGVVRAYRAVPGMTDRVVANVLTEFVSASTGRSYRVDYLSQKSHHAHSELKSRLTSSNLEAMCPKRILVNALTQVLESVNSFIMKKTSDDAYLRFIVGYFE